MRTGIGGLDVNISTYNGTIFLFVFAFFVAWFVINTGEKIIKSMPESKIYAAQKSTQEMIKNK